MVGLDHLRCLPTFTILWFYETTPGLLEVYVVLQMIKVRSLENLHMRVTGSGNYVKVCVFLVWSILKFQYVRIIFLNSCLLSFYGGSLFVYHKWLQIIWWYLFLLIMSSPIVSWNIFIFSSFLLLKHLKGIWMNFWSLWAGFPVDVLCLLDSCPQFYCCFFSLLMGSVVWRLKGKNEIFQTMKNSKENLTLPVLLLFYKISCFFRRE